MPYYLSNYSFFFSKKHRVDQIESKTTAVRPTLAICYNSIVDHTVADYVYPSNYLLTVDLNTLQIDTYEVHVNCHRSKIEGMYAPILFSRF